MERVTNKLKTDNEALKMIADYLIDFANKELSFKEKILNEKKTLDDCFEYIKSEARKLAENNSAMVDDKTVFGWAVHYFDEDNLEWKSVKANVKTTKKQKEVDLEDDDEDMSEEIDDYVAERKPKIKKVVKKPTKTKEESNQISLFDFM